MEKYENNMLEALMGLYDDDSIADMLDVAQSTVNRWRRGETSPSKTNKEKILAVYCSDNAAKYYKWVALDKVGNCGCSHSCKEEAQEELDLKPKKKTFWEWIKSLFN